VGLNKQSAARFSFLMSIPVIAAAGSYYIFKLASSDEIIDWSAILLGSVLSFVSAYFCIHFFLKVIERMGMMPFVVYRLLLGLGLFAFLLL
jgi:undecaprenyl-diphosphatase